MTETQKLDNKIINLIGLMPIAEIGYEVCKSRKHIYTRIYAMFPNPDMFRRAMQIKRKIEKYKRLHPAGLLDTPYLQELQHNLRRLAVYDHFQDYRKHEKLQMGGTLHEPLPEYLKRLEEVLNRDPKPKYRFLKPDTKKQTI